MDRMHASPSLLPIFLLIIVLLFENRPYVESWIYKEDLYRRIVHRRVPPLLLSQSQREDFLFPPPPPPSHTSRPPSFQTSHRLSASPPHSLVFSSYLLVTRCLPSSSRHRSPSYSSLHCLTPWHLLTFGSLAGSAPRWLQLQFFFFLPGKQLKEARLGPPEILIPFQSLPCCQKRLQKRQIRRLKNTFSPFFSHCSNFITIQQIRGNFMIRDGSY